jgi:hypothetical protein
MKHERSQQFSDKIPNFMKIHPVGAELFHADGQTEEWTDMTKIIIAFYHFANMLKVTTFHKAPKKPLESDTQETFS